MKDEVLNAIRGADDNFGSIDRSGKNFINKEDIQTFLKSQKDSNSQQMGETLLHNFPVLTEMNDWGSQSNPPGITRKNLELAMGLSNIGSVWDYSYPASHPNEKYVIGAAVGMLGAALTAGAMLLPQLRSARAFEVAVGTYAVGCSGLVGGMAGIMTAGLLGDIEMKKTDNYYAKRLNDAQRMVL